MAEQKRGPGRPPKARRKDVVPVPQSFEPDEEFGLTEMQAAFVFWYTEGACSGTEAARRAGFSFPAAAASRLVNGRDHPNVVKAINVKRDEIRTKYAITPEKTGRVLWEITEEAFKNGAYNAAVSAVKELHNLAGLTVHRTQNLNINANLDTMSKDDVRRRLNELLGVDESMSDKDL